MELLLSLLLQLLLLLCCFLCQIGPTSHSGCSRGDLGHLGLSWGMLLHTKCSSYADVRWLLRNMLGPSWFWNHSVRLFTWYFLFGLASALDNPHLGSHKSPEGWIQLGWQIDLLSYHCAISFTILSCALQSLGILCWMDMVQTAVIDPRAALPFFQKSLPHHKSWLCGPALF